MSEYLRFGPVMANIPPHPLIPEGHQFSPEDIVLITDFGDILPPLEFCKRQFDRVMWLGAGIATLFDNERTITLARYLSPKLSLNDDTGCWELPLKAEYDDQGRARYPQVTISSLGYSKQLAHRATVEVFFGIPLPRGEGKENPIDHRCMNHACCNPYHLEVVTPAENNRRKEIAKKRKIHPDLFHHYLLEVKTFGQLVLLNMHHNSHIDEAL